MELHRRATGAVAVAATLVAVALPARGAPVCADEPRAVCGNRIFPEALVTATFVQHDDGEFVAGIKALAKEYPRYVRVRNLSKVLGRRVRSEGGRPIYLIEVTDFRVPERDKVDVMVSLSVHGPERAGLEGGVRYAEDLARWATGDPDRELRNGTERDSVGFPVRDVLRRVHLYLANINPDGWANGDLANGGVFMRGNGNGVDLNREFPTLGWTYVPYTALSESESKAWDRLVRRVDPLVAADLHGELTSAQNAFADIMYPAGQWNPVEQAREERLARHMTSNVVRYFAQENVVAGIATGVAGMRPAEFATAYDVVGYDDSGFMGDYFTQVAGAVEVDVEHFLSHLVPNSTWVGGLEQAHVAAVRGEIETLMVEAVVTKRVRVELDLGRAGYLFDPEVVTDADGYGGPKPPKRVTPAGYRVTRMAYFEDLSRHARQPLRLVAAADVARGALADLDTLVIADEPFPRDPRGVAYERADFAAGLRGFVRAGGNLVLTDGALRLLGPLRVVAGKTVRRELFNAGHINVSDFSDRYLKGVHTTASQTYYEVPIGYSVNEDASPHWTVERPAWEDAGGKTIAFITAEDRVGLGRFKLGKGTIGILGALLPQPTEKFDHLYGLADYAVTVAGGQILNNMIALGR